MSSLPAWPEAGGPRVLTLVGNNITIDVRARKTASSLARAGFSVIALGVDEAGVAQTGEILDGALLHRVVPPLDPRVSPRWIRLSRAELRDWLRYRVELQRRRLQMARRNLTAWRHWNRRSVSPAADSAGRAWEESSKRVGVPERYREGLARKIRSRLNRYVFLLTLRVKKARVLGSQARFVAYNTLYKAAARRPARTFRQGRWRRDLPELHRYEAVLGPIVDYLQPDLIHVHDVFHIGLAVRAAARAAEAERRVRVVYDAHEFVAGLPVDPRRRSAYADLEAEHIGRVDAVVTVSSAMAEAIAARYGVEPKVVMNTPDLDTMVDTTPVREVVGLPEARIVAYVGGLAPHRGPEDLIAALSHLPLDTHLVFVSGASTGFTNQLVELAREMGVEDRVHFAPFVPPESVVPYIRSVDVTVIPLSREVLNYEVTLPNKLFQSIHAGVPVAVSDNMAIAEFVTEHGVGEVFPGGDAQALAKAIQTILDDPGAYRAALSDPELLQTLTWRHQVEVLLGVYRGLGVATDA